MRPTSFFENNVTTTLSSNETVQFIDGDYVQIFISNLSSATPTASSNNTRVLYRVKTYTTVNVTPAPPLDYRIFLPTPKEVHRISAIKGGKSESSKHSRTPKKALVLRSSYQDMARLPCYRKTRHR